MPIGVQQEELILADCQVDAILEPDRFIIEVRDRHLIEVGAESAVNPDGIRARIENKELPESKAMLVSFASRHQEASGWQRLFRADRAEQKRARSVNGKGWALWQGC